MVFKFKKFFKNCSIIYKEKDLIFFYKNLIGLYVLYEDFKLINLQLLILALLKQSLKRLSKKST